jgi:tripartite-type tricarboxylate transporter receptor subunit TctC
MAPAKTPKDIIARWNAEVDKILKSPDLQKRFIADGLEPMGDSPQAFDKFVRDEIAKYERVVKAANLSKL